MIGVDPGAPDYGGPKVPPAARVGGPGVGEFKPDAGRHAGRACSGWQGHPIGGSTGSPSAVLRCPGVLLTVAKFDDAEGWGQT